MPAKRKEEAREEAHGTFTFADGSTYTGQYALLSSLLAEASVAPAAVIGKHSSGTSGPGAGAATASLSPALADAAAAASAAANSGSNSLFPQPRVGPTPSGTNGPAGHSSAAPSSASPGINEGGGGSGALLPMSSLDPPLPHGIGMYRDSTGAWYEGFWKDGRMCGEGVMALPHGTTYLGSFSDGKYHGFGRYTWVDGSSYEGDFVEGTMHGIGVYVDAQGRRWHGTFARGQSVSLNMEIDL